MTELNLFDKVPRAPAHEDVPARGPFPPAAKGSDVAEAGLLDDPDPKLAEALANMPKPTDGVDFSDAVIHFDGTKGTEVGEAKTAPFGEPILASDLLIEE